MTIKLSEELVSMANICTLHEIDAAHVLTILDGLMASSKKVCIYNFKSFQIKSNSSFTHIAKASSTFSERNSKTINIEMAKDYS